MQRLRAGAAAAVCIATLACAGAARGQVTSQVAVFETAIDGGRGGSTFFVIDKIDGTRVENSVNASRRASYGRGADMRIATKTHFVASGTPVTLTLVGQYGYAMPIAQIVAGSRNEVSGEVRVELRPDVAYRVNGVLDDFRSEVWIEEAHGGRIVSEKVVRAPSAREVAEAAGADRYTCCNVRHEGAWISDGNFTSQPFIPAGARVKVTGWGRNRVHANVAGRAVSAGIDQPQPVETREQLAERLFVAEDPRPRIAAWPPEVRAAVEAGKVRLGMTKEQVVVAIGHPRRDRTPDLAAAHWVYLSASGEEFDLDFDADGRVSAFNGIARARRSAWIDG